MVIILCFLTACTVKNKPDKEESENNQITLIFKSPPPKWKVFGKIGGYTPTNCEIKFIDDNFIPIQFFPTSEHKSDTLIIKTKRKVVEIRHSYKDIDELSYILHNGDTVLFTYKDKTSIASVLNRETKTYDVNFDLFKKETFYPEGYSSYVKYRNLFFMKPSKNLQQELDRMVEIAKNNFSSKVGKEKTLLDSLSKNDLISSENYQFFNTQFIYEKK